MTDETAVALTTPETAVAVLTDEAKFSDFLRRIKEETSKLVPDVTTPKGRKEIAAMAFKVTKTKTAIDAERKRLTEDAREKIKVVDAAGRKIREELDAHAAEVRKPLTDWEDAEDARVRRVDQDIENLRKHAVILADETSDQLAARLESLRGAVISDEVYQDQADIARNLLEFAIAAVENGLKAAIKREADAAELARLQAEKAEREARDAEIKAEAERKAKEEADARAKVEADKAAKEAQELAAKEAADKAAADAAEAARRAAQAEIDAANARAAEIERKAEEDRHAAEAEKKLLADEKAAAEKAEAARIADREHRAALMGEAKRAIMVVLDAGAGLTSEQIAVSIVRAVVGNEIPNMEFKF